MSKFQPSSILTQRTPAIETVETVLVLSTFMESNNVSVTIMHTKLMVDIAGVQIQVSQVL
jgi:hypothetical protein